MTGRIARKFSQYRGVVDLAWRFSSSHRGLLGSFVGLAVFGALTESFGVFLLVPLLQTMGQNNVFTKVPMLGRISVVFEALPTDKRLLWAGGLMLIIVLVRGALQFVQEFVGYIIPHRIDFHLRLRAYSTFLKTSLQFTDAVSAGELSNIAVGQPARIGLAIRFFAVLVANIAVVISYILLLSIVSPVLFILAILYVATTTLIFRTLTTNIVHGVGRELSQANEQFSQIFFETLNGTKLIRLAGATDYVQRLVESTVKRLQKARDNAAAVDNMTVPFFSTMGGVLICLVVMAAGVMPTESAGEAVGVLVIFFVLLLRILSPLSIISIARNNIIIHLDAFWEFDAFMARAERARERDGATRIEGFRSEISLDDVSFSYRADGPTVLEGISFVVPKGHMVAVVGPSGAGKSTIINLIARLYRPNSGRVLVDGIDVNEIAVESWWHCLGVVTQDVVIVNDTIRANLCFGLVKRVSDSDLRTAAKLAAIDEWIESLPDRYDTQLGDRGARLSGGQRQRIALARAFLRDPDVIILDEATSALDTLTERTIQQQIQALARRKTMIVIAHRLSTVRRANTIVLVENGRVAEIGDHNELINRRGTYWRMIESQSLDLIEDNEDRPLASAG